MVAADAVVTPGVVVAADGVVEPDGAFAVKEWRGYTTPEGVVTPDGVATMDGVVTPHPKTWLHRMS